MQKDKIRDMLRSILPSKGERSARYEKTHANKKNRVNVRQTLRQYNKGEWGDDSEDKMVLRIHESDRTRRRDIRTMKMERRAADKISHFVHWCERKTAHIPEDNPKEKYYYISGLIGGPSDLIREHALGHFLDPEYHFNVVAREGWRYRWQRVKGVNGSGHGEFDREAFVRALRWAYERCPAHLNRALKGGYRDSLNGGALLWRGCTPDDDCTTVRIEEKPYYTWQAKDVWFVRSGWDKPWSYREGTLVSHLADREITYHDSRVCENKILVTREEDIERITDKLFGNSEVYHEPYYGRDRGLYRRLIPFLMAKGVLEKRDG